jgi:hypothetical protein
MEDLIPEKHPYVLPHTLRASKGGKVYDVPCEDGASVDGVLMWLYELKLDAPGRSGLVRAVHEWVVRKG